MKCVTLCRPKHVHTEMKERVIRPTTDDIVCKLGNRRRLSNGVNFPRSLCGIRGSFAIHNFIIRTVTTQSDIIIQ